ncbi:MAG TPA: BamA/TamA family outer membrane protein [Phnomibacter sp.]|nr:BamA/TamA family outer membrane protein [Phnomibacter sp.]
MGQQEGFRLMVAPLDSSAMGYKVRTTFPSKEQLEKYLQALPSELLSKGYLAASVDSIKIDSTTATIALFLGPRYSWSHIDVDAAYRPLLQELRLPGAKGKRGTKPFAYEDLRERLLDHFEENGYPFAGVGYDSVQVQGSSLSGKLVIDKGVFYRIDSIAQSGSLRQTNAFIHRYLGFTPGEPYQRSKLEKIGQRLNELPFAQQQRPWDLSMLGTGAVVNVYLEQRRSNILNVLLGVMPASTQTPGNKLLVTGDANILLRNSFRAGETIGVNWQQIQYQSPRLNLMYEQPYLFGSKAGADIFFDLFKKDTQFVNLQLRLGMPYEFDLTRSGKVFFHYQQTNVTWVDTNYVLQTGRLPDLAASTASSLGVDYTINTTNYRLNPRTGHEVRFSVLGGIKRIAPSQEIENLKDPSDPNTGFAALYDTLELKTYQVRIKAQAAKYFPLGRSSVVKVGVNGGLYQSGNYFRNELYQIGGFRLLRGFDEESIFARQYLVFTSEYRLLSGRNSYFFGFVDGGYAGYKDRDLEMGHGYLGSGLGLVLETKNSLINLSWAIGKRNDLPLDLRQSKIHLGLINFF